MIQILYNEYIIYPFLILTINVWSKTQYTRFKVLESVKESLLSFIFND